MDKIGIYAGSFNPIHCGHLVIITKALKIFDKVVVLIADNPSKKESCFATRMSFAKQATEALGEKVEVCYAKGLVVDFALQYAKKNNTKSVTFIKGLRSGIDFLYEKSLAEYNKAMSSNSYIPVDLDIGGIDTIYFQSNLKYDILSSSVIREMAKVSETEEKFIQFNKENNIYGFQGNGNESYYDWLKDIYKEYHK